jgi:hypothetical protein
VGEGTARERRFHALLDELAVEGPHGWTLRDQPQHEVGIVTWEPAGSR